MLPLRASSGRHAEVTLVLTPGRCGGAFRPILALSVALLFSHVAAEESDPQIEWIATKAGAYGLRGTIAVEARREAIWAMLIDYERFPEIYQDVSRVDVRDAGAGGATVVIHVENFWTSYEYVSRRDYVEPGRRIAWRQIEGPYRSLSGEWVIRDGPDERRHFVVCTTMVELESPVKAFVARQFAAARMRDTLLHLRWMLDAAGRQNGQ